MIQLKITNATRYKIDMIPSIVRNTHAVFFPIADSFVRTWVNKNKPTFRPISRDAQLFIPPIVNTDYKGSTNKRDNIFINTIVHSIGPSHIPPYSVGETNLLSHELALSARILFYSG